MKWNKRNINVNSMDPSRSDPWFDPDSKIVLQDSDISLFEKIGDYMKGNSDIKDVKDDPFYSEIDGIVTGMLSDNMTVSSGIIKNEKYITESLDQGRDELRIEEEIRDVLREINDKRVDEVAAGWVKAWNDQKGRGDAGKEEIRNFIAGSFGNKSEAEADAPAIKRPGRSLYIRYTAIAAAVIAGAIFAIRSLIPANSPDRLFDKYYMPLGVISAVTRSTGSDAPGNLSRALENYRNGMYEEALFGFSDVLQNDTSFVSARFFIGITDIALEKYDLASQLLREAAGRQFEYTKEARWYLGLALLKEGDSKDAMECFRMLAQSPGFYSERAEKILRRLR